MREREARAEYRINIIRGVAILAAAALDLATALFTARLTPAFAAEGIVLLLLSAAYVGAVHHLSRHQPYRPWLKYVTVTADYSLTLLIFVEYRRLGFFAGRGPEAGAAEFTAFLILLNILSAFRHGRAIIVYSTILGMLDAVALAATYGGSLALAIYAPAALAGSGFLTYMLSSGLEELFQRLRRRDSLMRFLPRQVVKSFDSGQIGLSLGGIKREATVLLADLRDSTHLAEHRDPEEVVHTLNDYFTAMAEVIWGCEGTIDKFMGDAVLAVFGAPVRQDDHASRAVRAALRMHEALRDLNARRALRSLPPLRMGIALHTGVVLAGNVGSPERMEYTVMGDVVNVTARIEELNKTYGTHILLSETTLQRVPDLDAALPLGEVRLRGRDEPVRLFRLPVEC